MGLYKKADSAVWWANITVNRERIRFSTGEYDQAKAQRVHDQRKAAQHDAPKLRGKTWGQAVIKWAQTQTRSESDLLCLVKFGKHYKDRSLSSVTVENVEEALNKFVKTEGTYNRYIARISAIAKLSGLELKFTKKRDRNAKERDWITQEQWKKLYAELPLHLQYSASFSVLTGLRQANVLGLQWRRVDLGRRMAFIEGVDTKSGKAIGVPLSDEAIAVLEAVKGQHPEYVFTFRGEPYKEVKTAFIAACVRAGVGRYVSGKYRGFTWHGLRHTWATWHAQAGTPLEVIKELGGWHDMRMLARYAHHVPGIKANYAGNLGLKK